MTKTPKVPGLPTQPRCTLWMLGAVAVLVVVLVGVASQTLAQQEGNDWTAPVNLSHSGTASDPVVVTKPDGTLRVFWWDKFDGLMVADGSMPITATQDLTPTETIEGEIAEPVPASIVWTTPRSAPILLPVPVVRQGQEGVVPTPIAIMPHIVSDASGNAHAMWLGAADRDTGAQPLLYSRLAADSISWSSPSTIDAAASSFDVSTDLTGTLHLVYARPVQAQDLPIGLYYRHSTSNGTNWSTPTAIYQSRYMRLLSPVGDPLRVTAAGGNDLYVTWDDPHLGRVLVAHSADGGTTWDDPQPALDSDAQLQKDHVIAMPGNPTPLLWAPPGAGQDMMAVSSAGDTLMLARWDGERWSEVRRLTPSVQDPASGEQVLLGSLQVALSQPAAAEGGGTLVVVGLDQNGDVWITGTQLEVLERAFGTQSPSGGDQAPEGPPTAVNLSKSGAASRPALLAITDGTLRAFWWDQFDGLMAADGVVSASTTYSGTEEIVTTRELWSEPRAVPGPMNTTPQIIADAAGRVHAFWLEAQGGQGTATGQTPALALNHSRLLADGTSWSPTAVLAQSAVSFAVADNTSSGLHVAYVQTAQTQISPAGVYYRQSTNGGADWTPPTPLYLSRYLRLLSPDMAHLNLAASDAGGVAVTWDDPRLEQLLLAYSPDGGVTWEGPRPIGDPEEHSQRGRLVPIPGGEILLLWRSGDSEGTCNLVQASVNTLLGDTTAAGQRVLEELTTCPEDERFLPLDEGQVLMLVGSGSDTLTLAAWDGEQWSEPRRVSFRFEDLESGGQIYLSDLQASLVALPSEADEGLAHWALIAVGTDQQGDVWATSSQQGALEIAFAPPPPWSAPVRFSQSDAYPDLPAVATDSEGGLNLLWSEAALVGEPGTDLFYARWDGSQWTGPASVLQSAAGTADEPALAAVGDRLHAVWVSGHNREVLYSSAFARDAYTAGGWSKPQSLPGPQAAEDWPDIEADASGALHVVYAVPLNEGRGIYYTRSDDGGANWSEVCQVFNAAAAGWAMTSRPRLAVDVPGLLHVVWVRDAAPGSGPPEGVYYARSVDGGQTWSEPIEMALGAYTWPQIAVSAPGQVHVLWGEATGQRAWWHRWSTDGGGAWTRSDRVPGFGNVPGPASLMAEGNGALHLAGMGPNDRGEPVLSYTVWDGERWSRAETFHPGMETVEPGLIAGLLPTLRRLDVTFRGKEKGEAEAGQVGLWHTDRLIPTMAVAPAPTFIPPPTATPSPTPTPTATPTPALSFGSAPPPPEGGSMEIPLSLLLAGGLAMLLVVVALGMRLLWASRR